MHSYLLIPRTVINGLKGINTGRQKMGVAKGRGTDLRPQFFLICWITLHLREFQSVAIGKKCTDFHSYIKVIFCSENPV